MFMGFGISIFFLFKTIFAMMLFFYFLPARKAFLFPYVVGFAFFGYFLGIVLQQLDLFEYVGMYIYFAPVIFIIWFSIAAWVYLKNGNITVK